MDTNRMDEFERKLHDKYAAIEEKNKKWWDENFGTGKPKQPSTNTIFLERKKNTVNYADLTVNDVKEEDQPVLANRKIIHKVENTQTYNNWSWKTMCNMFSKYLEGDIFSETDISNSIKVSEGSGKSKYAQYLSILMRGGYITKCNGLIVILQQIPNTLKTSKVVYEINKNNV